MYFSYELYWNVEITFSFNLPLPKRETTRATDFHCFNTIVKKTMRLIEESSMKDVTLYDSQWIQIHVRNVCFFYFMFMFFI